MLPPIEEIKHNLDGTTERFNCYLVHRGPEYVVLCYISDMPYAVAAADVPAGSLTIGHYRPGNDYVLWQMYTPQAELLGYYVHLCDEIRLGDRSVEWYDMVVDVWLGSDGRFEILDEDELERSVDVGRIGHAEANKIISRARQLKKNATGITQKLKHFDPAELLSALSPRQEG